MTSLAWKRGGEARNLFGNSDNLGSGRGMKNFVKLSEEQKNIISKTSQLKGVTDELLNELDINPKQF